MPPQADADHPLPLVLYLHGNGGQGFDNRRHVDAQVTRWVARQPAQPCFVIAPQLPHGTWVNADPRRGNYALNEAAASEPLQRVIGIVELFLKRHPIDRARIYVVGSSLGAFGSWELMMRKPEWFAAGVAIDGAGDPKQVVRMANIPVWSFHGAADSVVPVAAARELIAALKAIGASPRYTEYPGVDQQSAPRAFAPATGLDAWLFAQRRH